MLHHAAHHLAGMRGQRESLQVIQFKQKSLTAVNRQLQTLRGSCDDWTIIGIGLLANAEVSSSRSRPFVASLTNSYSEFGVIEK